MRLVFDSEGNGFYEDADTVWCIVLTDLDNRDEGYPGFGPDEIEQALAVMWEADEIIGHNILEYDLPLFEKVYGWKPNPKTKITDTLILSRLYKSDRRLPPGCPGNVAPHSIEAWGYRVGRAKPGHDDWSQFSPEMLHRCTEDTEINCLVYWELMKERGNHDWQDAEETEHRITPEIWTQAQTGVPLDRERCEALYSDIGQRIAAIDSRWVPVLPPVALSSSKQYKWPSKQFKKNGEATVHAKRYYGEDHSEYRTDEVIRTEPMNLNSDKQVKEYLLSIGWVPTEWNYKKDPETNKPLRDAFGDKIKTSPKLTLDSLESCSWPEGYEEAGGAIVQRLMLAHRSSMLKGWLRDVRPDGRISASATPMGTPTSRMTHRGVVNVPGVQKDDEDNILYGIEGGFGYELRSCMGSTPDRTRVGIDLKSCQIHALCHYMPDEGYRQAVRDGDPHIFVQEMAALPTRREGKKLHYTVLFGGGPDKIASDLGLSKQMATIVQKRFFANVPELDKLLKILEAEWKANDGWITGLDGRKVWVRAKHMLLVYLLQSMEAIVMKNFMIFLIDIAKSLGLDYQLVTTMHDECQFLVVHEHVDKFITAAYAAIEAVNAKFNLEFPQAIDVQTGNTWAECH